MRFSIAAIGEQADNLEATGRTAPYQDWRKQGFFAFFSLFSRCFGARCARHASSSMLRLPVIETARAIPIVTINPDASSTDPSSSCTAPPCIVFLSKGKSIGRSHKESAQTQIEAAE